LKGLEDDIAIWNNTLTDGQAKALYNTPVLFGLGVNNQYGAGTMNSLFTLYGQGASGTPVPVGSLTWQYMAPGTTGHNAGDAWTVGGNYYVQLGTDGSGVEATTIPEPGTLILLAAGLIGLLCYAWRKRR
jgi:hypothetical protein